MKMKLKKITNHIFSFLFCLILFSCNFDIHWFGDLEKDLSSQLETKITFYASEDTGSPCVTYSYIQGKTLNAQDFPNNNEDILNLKPGYKVTGWKFSTSSLINGVSYNYTDNNTGLKWLKVPDTPIDLYASWIARDDTPYKVRLYYENISDDNFTLENTITLKGTTDTSITVDQDFINENSLEKEGFEFNSSSSTSSVIINGQGNATVDIKFNRQVCNITLNSSSGQFDSQTGKSVSVRGKYGAPFSFNNIPTKSGYKFWGWNENSEVTYDTIEAAQNAELILPQKFTKDLTLYPVWGPNICFVELYDQEGKTLTGTPRLSLTEKDGAGCYIWRDNSDLILDVPQILDTEKSNNVTFINWKLYDNDLEVPISNSNTIAKTYDIGSDKNGVFKFYAIYKYKTIYVDPSNGDDNNNGMSPSTPLKTVEEAKKYDFEQISLLSSITRVEDVVNLSGTPDKPTFVNRYTSKTSFNFSLINFKDDVVMDSSNVLKNVILDGGAGFKEEDNNTSKLYFTNGEEEWNKVLYNHGKTSSSSLIYNSGTINIGENVVIQNSHFTDTGAGGAAILNYGTLNIEGTLSDPVIIKNNYTAAWGGGIANLSNHEVNLTYVNFENNASAKQGGALFVSDYNENSTVNLSNIKIEKNRALNSGGAVYLGSNTSYKITINMNDVSFIQNYTANATEGNGTGGVYLSKVDFNATNCTFTSNKSIKSGGAITTSNSTKAKLINTNFENNMAENGSAIFVSGGNATLGTGTKISSSEEDYKQCVNVTSGTLIFDGGYVDKDCLVYIGFNNNSYNCKIGSSAFNTNLYNSNSNKIATITTNTYDTTKPIIKLDNSSVTGNIPSLFNVLPFINEDSEEEQYILTQASTSDDAYLQKIVDLPDLPENNSELIVTTAEHLQKIATKINDGSWSSVTGLTIKQNNDIVLSSISNWQPIGNNTYKFKYKYDGNNYAIKNLNLTTNTDNSPGLFGVVENESDDNKAELANINLESGTVTVTGNNTAYVGSLVSELKGGTVKNCHSNVTINNQSTDYQVTVTGGLIGNVGASSINIYDCSYTGIMTSTNGAQKQGGIVGHFQIPSGYSYIYNCYSSATINSSEIANMGGIVGYKNGSGNLYIENCYFSGKLVNNISSSSTSRCLQGGIIGKTDGSTVIKNCVNYGTFTSDAATNYHVVGNVSFEGISGVSVYNCYASDTSKSFIFTNTYNTSSNCAYYKSDSLAIINSSGSSANVSVNETNFTNLTGALNSWANSSTDRAYKKWKQDSNGNIVFDE